jgi:hypothetical protein
LHCRENRYAGADPHCRENRYAWDSEIIFDL